jgi:hypothetical protein
MRPSLRCLSFGTMVLLFLAPVPGGATSNRIFVSTTGNNANDCSNPLTPCVDFTGAMSQVNTGGEIIAQATGPYGPLNITKAITISGPPGVVIYSGHQVTVNAPGATVVLRGLTIDGNGANEDGIHVTSVGSLSVESCVISNFANAGILMSAAGTLSVKNTDIKGCGLAGIQISNSSGAVTTTIDHCHLDGNLNGFQAQPTAGGSSLTTAIHSTADHNFTGWICGNASDGFAQLNLDFCTANSNGGDGIYSDCTGLGFVYFAFCVIANNGGVGIGQLHNGFPLSRGNNTVTGNFAGPTSGTVGTYSPM